MKAHDVMSSPVSTIGPRATIRAAIEMMLGSHVSGLPVVDGEGKLVGIVSEGDLLRRDELGTEKRHARWVDFLLGTGHAAQDYVHTHGRYVEEVMTPDPIVVEPDSPLEEVVDIMERRRLKRVPVVRGGKVIGIVTRADLMASLLAAEKSTTAKAGDDTVIHGAIVAELDKQAWVPSSTIKIDVVDGAVTLSGTIDDERERRALRVAVENTPGVKAVYDKLVWVDAYGGASLGPPEITD